MKMLWLEHLLQRLRRVFNSFQHRIHHFFFLICIPLVAWRVFVFFVDLKPYLTHTVVLPATPVGGFIVSHGEDSFSLKVSYKISKGKEVIVVESETPKPYHLNYPSAEKALKDLLKERYRVVYCMPGSFLGVSSTGKSNLWDKLWYSDEMRKKVYLERAFPIKSLCYLILFLGTLGWIGVNLGRYQKTVR